MLQKLLDEQITLKKTNHTKSVYALTVTEVDGKTKQHRDKSSNDKLLHVLCYPGNSSQSGIQRSLEHWKIVLSCIYYLALKYT